MGQTHIERNAAGLARLRALAARQHDDDLGRTLDGEWTIVAALAHLAFWDRFMLARWERAARDGRRVPPSIDDETIEDLVNAAALPGWRACAPREAMRLALAAAEAVDGRIAALDDEVVADVLASGRARLMDRSLHRDEHLAAIERILGHGAG